jgi:hypothetical protein
MNALRSALERKANRTALADTAANTNSHFYCENNALSSPDAASTPVAAVITGIAIGDEGFPRSATRG